MKKVRILLLTMLCCMLCAAGVQAGNGQGTVYLRSIENSGNSLRVICGMEGIESFTNGKLRIRYDASQVKLLETEKGELLDGFVTAVNDPVTGNRQEGEVILAFASEESAVGNGTLLTLHFEKAESANGKPMDVAIQVEELASESGKITPKEESLHLEPSENGGQDDGNGGGDDGNGGNENKYINISNLKVKAPSKKVYNRKKRTPSVKVYDGTAILKKGRDYTLAYKKNKKAGRAFIYIKGQGRYTGTRRVSFYITTMKQKIFKISSPKKGTIRLRWKRAGQGNGYQIQYALRKSFKKGKKSILVKKKTTLTRTIKKCRSGKTYYVRVRSYKKIDGKRVYGPFSKIKRIRVK